MKSLSFVCLAVRPSLNFLKIGSLGFSMLHDDSLPWYLVTDEAKFLKKENLVVRIWAQWI